MDPHFSSQTLNRKIRFISIFFSLLNEPLLWRQLHLELVELESGRVELLLLGAVRPVEAALLLGHGDEDEDADEGEEDHDPEHRGHDVDEVGRDGAVVEGRRRGGEGVLKRSERCV